MNDRTKMMAAIREEVFRKGLGLTEFATLCNTNVSQMCSYMNGRLVPGSRKLQKFADALGMQWQLVPKNPDQENNVEKPLQTG